MKRVIVTALLAAMLLAFSACGDSDKNPSDGSDTTVISKDEQTAVSDTEVDIETDSETTKTDTVSVTETTVLSETVASVVTDSPVTTTVAPVTHPPASRPADYPAVAYTPDELAAFDSTKNGWGQGINVDSLNRPTGATYAQNVYGQYGGIYIMPETDPAYLTFDLGYEYGCTGRILDTLNEKGVKGTFFVTMYYVEKNPELVRRMIDEGHIVGNHSVNHLSMPTLSVSEMENEIMGLHNYVRDNFGYEMYLFRPPMGEYSVQSLAVAQNLGYRSVLWSYTYYDYDVNNQLDTATAYAKVTGAAHKGAVYLLHGVSETNTAILGDVIDYLRTSGIGVANEW